MVVAVGKRGMAIYLIAASEKLNGPIISSLSCSLPLARMPLTHPWADEHIHTCRLHLSTFFVYRSRFNRPPSRYWSNFLTSRPHASAHTHTNTHTHTQSHKVAQRHTNTDTNKEDMPRSIIY